MLGKTSISALRGLTYLARQEQGACVSPRRMAEALGESPTYLAKITRHLVKAGILEAEKGVKGGVRLARTVDRITALAVVEACQGTLVGDFCRSGRSTLEACNFHLAALELHNAITGVLERWTLADFLERPEAQTVGECLMSGVAGGMKDGGGQER